MVPLNFSNLAGASGLAGAGAAGATVVAGFAGAGFCCAMAPETNATNVRIATKRIIFFILLHLLSFRISKIYN
jgi:hypothetical protein